MVLDISNQLAPLNPQRRLEKHTACILSGGIYDLRNGKCQPQRGAELASINYTHYTNLVEFCQEIALFG